MRYNQVDFPLKNGTNVTRCFREENIFLSTLGEFPSLERREREREKEVVEGKPPAAKRFRVPLSWTNLNISSARAACKSISRAEIYGRGAYGCFI